MRRASIFALGGALFAALVFTLFAPGAGAQEDDPYGGTTTTTTRPGEAPSCMLKTKSAPPGGVATVTVRGVPRNSTVRLLFDGTQVAEADATGPGNSPTVHVDMSFTVPLDATEGPHDVVAVGVNFSVTCKTGNGEGFQVLAAEFSRGGGGGGSLPKTGIYVLVFLALAVALLLLGRVLVEEARRRRRRAAAMARRNARHLAESSASTRE